MYMFIYRHSDNYGGCSKKDNSEIKNDNENTVNSIQQNNEYSDDIQKILNTKVVELDNKKIGDLIDNALIEYSWGKVNNIKQDKLQELFL